MPHSAAEEPPRQTRRRRIGLARYAHTSFTAGFQKCRSWAARISSRALRLLILPFCRFFGEEASVTVKAGFTVGFADVRGQFASITDRETWRFNSSPIAVPV